MVGSTKTWGGRRNSLCESTSTMARLDPSAQSERPGRTPYVTELIFNQSCQYDTYKIIFRYPTSTKDTNQLTLNIYSHLYRQPAARNTDWRFDHAGCGAHDRGCPWHRYLH